jgi:hypothetical protein
MRELHPKVPHTGQSVIEAINVRRPVPEAELFISICVNV